MTKTMLTVFVLAVVLTACDVLGDDDSSCEEKYCNLDLAHNLCMENIDLTQADGKWDLMSISTVPPYFQNFIRVSYDLIYNASGTPANTEHVKRTIVMTDGTCRIEAWTFDQEDCPSRLSAEVTLPDGTTKQKTLNFLATDYEILLFYSQNQVNNNTRSNIGLVVRDLGATLDWSVVDDVLTKICSPRPHDGNWTDFFHNFDFNGNAACQDTRKRK